MIIPDHEIARLCKQAAMVLPYNPDLQNPASRVSYHVLIAPDGTRARLVADTHVAWHAGVSSFQGRTDCNNFLLGVSFAGDTYAAPLTADQLASALDWLAPRRLRHGWTPACMTDHRQIAPALKNDLAPPRTKTPVADAPL